MTSLRDTVRVPAPPRASRAAAGFTLIEVIGALVILSVALLLTTGLTASLTVQMRQATLMSELVATAQVRLDSLAVLSYSQVPLGVTVDTLELLGTSYVFTQEVVLHSSWLREVRVSLDPQVPPGPDFDFVTYVRPPW